MDRSQEAFQAADPRSASELLRALARREGSAVQRALAGNPATPPDVLEGLAATGRPSVCERVASNPNTPLGVLWGLLGEHGALVVANPVFSLLLMMQPDLGSYPLAALEQLARGPEWAPGGHDALLDLAYERRARFWPLPALLAQNPHVSPALLRRLASLSPSVAELGSHPSLPPELLAELVARHRGTRFTDALCACARNPSASPELLAGLASERSEWVRQAVASHPSLPLPSLIVLLKDASHYVRSAARQNPSLPLVRRRRGQARAAARRALTSCRSYRCSVRPAPASRRS